MTEKREDKEDVGTRRMGRGEKDIVRPGVELGVICLQRRMKHGA